MVAKEYDAQEVARRAEQMAAALEELAAEHGLAAEWRSETEEEHRRIQVWMDEELQKSNGLYLQVGPLHVRLWPWPLLRWQWVSFAGFGIGLVRVKHRRLYPEAAPEAGPAKRP